MSDEFSMGSAEETFDFSGDGITKGEYDFTITALEIEDKDNGTQHKLTYESPNAPFPITVGYWVSHTNEKAAQVGRGNLKRIATAALGQPKYTKATIEGAKVRATLSEDKDGFARITGFKPVPKAVEAVSL